MWHGIGPGEVGRIQVGTAHLVPAHAGRVGRLDAGPAPTDACVVDHDVEAAEALHHICDQLGHGLLIGKIDGIELGLAFHSGDFAHDGLALGLVARGDGHLRALTDEAMHNAPADPGVAAGDECDLVFQAHGLCVSSLDHGVPRPHPSAIQVARHPRPPCLAQVANRQHPAPTGGMRAPHDRQSATNSRPALPRPHCDRISLRIS